MKIFFFTLLFTLALNTPSYAAANGITKQQAADIATRTYPGRVLGVKLIADVFQVKTLSDKGEVRVIKVDAITGNILSGASNNERSGK